jgi:hypothetical protein
MSGLEAWGVHLIADRVVESTCVSNLGGGVKQRSQVVVAAVTEGSIRHTL